MEAAVRQRFERIEAILDGVSKNHASAIARMDRADARMDRAEERMDRADARMDRAEERMGHADARMDRAEARFEKRMKGFEQLVRIGMKELANQRKDFDSRINVLIDSHQRTEAVLRRFMSSFPKGGNGHSRSQN